MFLDKHTAFFQFIFYLKVTTNTLNRHTSLDQKPFGRQAFGRQAFGRQAFGRQEFGRQKLFKKILVDQSSVDQMSKQKFGQILGWPNVCQLNVFRPKDMKPIKAVDLYSAIWKHLPPPRCIHKLLWAVPKWNTVFVQVTLFNDAAWEKHQTIEMEKQQVKVEGE